MKTEKIKKKIEEKAKAYDEALERAKDVLTTDLHESGVWVIQKIFPELQESEDERIRKAILGLTYLDGIEPILIKCSITAQDIRKYLEKQKEQNECPEYCVRSHCIGCSIYEKQKEQKPVEKENTLTDFEETLNTFLFDFANSPIEDCEPKEYIKKHSAEILKAAYKELNAELQQDIFEAIQEGRREGYEVAKAEQKPVEGLKAERNGWYVCIKDYYCGGKKQCSVGDLVQAKGGMYIMGEEDISEWFRRAYYEEVRNAFDPNIDTNIPEKPVEWSEEDERMLEQVIDVVYDYCPDPVVKYKLKDWLTQRLKSIHPQPHTVSIKDATKFGNLEYERGVKDGIQYAKNHHWKPSEEQILALRTTVIDYPDDKELLSLYEDLKKL